MIILTSEQAAKVRGETYNGARLEPVHISSGLFVLPESVMNDANHAIHHSFLSGMPKRDVADSEWIRVEE